MARRAAASRQARAMLPRRSAAPSPLVKRPSASSASASLSNPPIAGVSARQQAAGDEAGSEGDEDAAQRLLVDMAADRLRRALALGGEPVVELLRLAAELGGHLARRAGDSAGGAAAHMHHQRGEIALERGDVLGDSLDIGLFGSARHCASPSSTS